MSATRQQLLDLAAQGHRAPIGTHLVLHRHQHPHEIQLDGDRLGGVIAEAATHYNTPLAMPLMDLSIEKECLLQHLDIPAEQIESYHFSAPPPCIESFPATAKMNSACDAIRFVAGQPGLMPMGMSIGPFSLMTKLVADPITPVFLAGTGLGPDDEMEIAVAERAIQVGTALVLQYVEAQSRAGARAIIVCEPAANLVFFSPNQLAESHEIFERYVMEPMRRIKARIEAAGAELVFHDCGELTPGMVSRIAGLDAAMVSLGSSRNLWADAAQFPASTVLYGNLPTKSFYSPQLTPELVAERASELARRMRESGHPFILGSECDVLSVPGQEGPLMNKVMTFLRAP
ncbi:MAG TPA: uroporphyrinogen decarboxylase family protein [Kiritimatiellia bacterium]|nr:uroporphyrinogen decarboxylase family protein [Kiritimatiellia bacterium]